MEEGSLLDEECLALESIFEDKFTRLQPDRIRLIIAPEGAEEGSTGMHHMQLYETTVLSRCKPCCVCICRHHLRRNPLDTVQGGSRSTWS